ncbi:HAT (Half-A-TPR) repeats protein [Rhizoctonia solani]|uniref:Pre-mRNA-splicing factor SYF1 n=1 Tax=Rhizoctonia solani TaxID=456999 RepID=A0A8H7IAE5_9AGAM|nr:HAT (Half-A-TPR) repeats protein [Rhizoctonia solani]
MDSLDALRSVLPLTVPIPSPVNNTSLLHPKDIAREEDLLRNPGSLQAWWTAIQIAKEQAIASQKTQTLGNPLLGPLANPQRGLWKAYLSMRTYYVLGKATKQKRSGARKKYATMQEMIEEDEFDAESWEGGLNGVVGWEEWKALVGVYERALMWLPTMPRLWLNYLTIFNHPCLPPGFSKTHVRRTYDRALRTLPPSLHNRIWPRYLIWAERTGGPTTVAVFRRYIAVDPSMTEHYTKLLIEMKRPLEAAKLLLGLARKAARGEYESPEGKSPYQLLGEWLDVVEAWAEDVGLDPDEIKPAEEPSKKEEEKVEPVSSTGTLIRLAGPMVPADGSGKPAETRPYDPDEDPTNTQKLDIEKIIHKDGLEMYKDQAGRLWTGLATYWIKRGEFDRASLPTPFVLTIRDFTQIFDAYAEFCETLISALMDELASPEDDEDTAETEAELDTRMRAFEKLMDRRPFLVNDVLLRRNPNDIQEWEKRVALWGADDEKVAETYTIALKTINPKKTTANAHQLYNPKDLESARRVLEKATKVEFKHVDELAEVWIEWSDMEIRNENFDEAIRVMQRATAIPKNVKINYHDQSLPVKHAFSNRSSLVITFFSAVLTGLLLTELQFQGLRTRSRAIHLPIAFELWNIYLAKFIKRYGGSKLERARDLFEQALEKCPEKHCKPLFLMYAQLEEEYGLAKRAMDIYDRATRVVLDQDKFDMFTIYIAKASSLYGLPATRPIYERALQVLPNKQTAELCLRFAQLERKLGEIDRARAIYAHASQFCDPRTSTEFWKAWNTFEIETGSEDTFREMLRIKRSVQAQYNTEVSFLAAQAQGAKKAALEKELATAKTDAMAQVEAKTAPSFVAGKKDVPANGQENGEGNADEIQIDDEEF